MISISTSSPSGCSVGSSTSSCSGTATAGTAGWNGGAAGIGTNFVYTAGASGGATDVRLTKGTNAAALRSRIMVAAGGSGAFNLSYAGDINYPGENYTVNQTSGYSFGKGQAAAVLSTADNTIKGAGGGGYWGAHAAYVKSGVSDYELGSGATSYVSGFTGCVAVTSSSSTSPRTGTNGASCSTGTSDNLCSIHYSGKYFTHISIIDGQGNSTRTYGMSNYESSMPNTAGTDTENGHSGNGYAKITYIGP